MRAAEDGEAVIDAGAPGHADEHSPIAPCQPLRRPVDEDPVNVELGHRGTDGMDMGCHGAATRGMAVMSHAKRGGATSL